MVANQFLGGFTKYEGIVFGALVVGVAAGLPSGLVGLGASARNGWSRSWAGRRAAAGAASGARRTGPGPAPGHAGQGGRVPLRAPGRPAAGWAAPQWPPGWRRVTADTTAGAAPRGRTKLPGGSRLRERWSRRCGPTGAAGGPGRGAAGTAGAPGLRAPPGLPGAPGRRERGNGATAAKGRGPPDSVAAPAWWCGRSAAVSAASGRVKA